MMLPRLWYMFSIGDILITHRKGHPSPSIAIMMDFGGARPARWQIHSRSEALQLQVPINPLLLIAYFKPCYDL